MHLKDFAIFFKKRDNFSRPEVAFLVIETFQVRGRPVMERICSLWEQILSFKGRPRDKEGE